MKVHFADQHQPFRSAPFFHDAGIRYMLQTFYSIHENGGRLSATYEVLNKFKHIIVDSGLFSIMFGAGSKALFDAKKAQEWLDEYVKFINGSQFTNATFVELDVQKKLGAEAAWELRKELKARINKGQVMNVYHLEDGNPDKLIDYSDYIAIGMPELRMFLSPKERISIARYISTKAILKGKKVHLLGCTEKKMMKDFAHCYSCDSTSWFSSMRYGHLKSDTLGRRPLDQIQKESISKYEKKWQRGTYVSCAVALLDYTRYAGDQS